MPRPLAARRQNDIVLRLRAADSVSVAELAHAFGVSQETIRRDLKALAAGGRLSLVHGGAVRRGAPASEPVAEDNAAGRAAIGRAAAALVTAGATVMLGAGGTTAAIARELLGRDGLTICTNAPAHALLMGRDARVFLLGGALDGDRGAAYGADAIAAIGNFRADIAFVAAEGFAEDGAATDYSREAAELHGCMMLSRHAFIVAEHHRLERRTPFLIPHFARAAGIILDRAPERPLAAAWEVAGVKVIVAQ
jgi:DeoR/GlpR family transcriptional regulator of sugar metabolism